MESTRQWYNRKASYNKNEVDNFLSKLRLPGVELPTSVPEAVSTFPRVRAVEQKPSRSVTGTKPEAFTFNGSRYEVTSWKEMLASLCERVHVVHRDRFEEVLDMKGKKKPYFSRNLGDLQTPAKINGTDIYVETNFNANQTIQIARNLIARFRYNKNDFSYELRP